MQKRAHSKTVGVGELENAFLSCNLHFVFVPEIKAVGRMLIPGQMGGDSAFHRPRPKTAMDVCLAECLHVCLAG